MGKEIFDMTRRIVIKNLKDKIFDIFSKYRIDPSSDRRQVYFGQLCEHIYKWCRDFSFIKKDINKFGMGEEIYNVTRRILTKDLKNKNEFYKYLGTSIKNARNEYYQKYESGFKNIIIIDWDNETDIFNTIIPQQNNENLQKDASYDYHIKIKTETLIDAVKTILARRQERARPCDKALFTLHCFKKIKDLEGLYPVLDSKTLEACKNNKEKPKQYEIYMEYHPEAQKNAAEAMASKNLKEFIKDLETYLKEKSQ
jgi:hypothetical protein